MHDPVFLVFTSFPDIATARHIGTELVTRQYAACVNLLPSAEAIYRWEGEICQEAEVWAVIKTTRHTMPLLESAIRELHPYTCPELVAVEAVGGLPAYLAWVAGCVNSPG